MVSANEVRARPPATHSDRPRVKVPINDRGFVEMAGRRQTLVDNCHTLDVNCIAVNCVVLLPGSQKKSRCKK